MTINRRDFIKANAAAAAISAAARWMASLTQCALLSRRSFHKSK